MQSTFDQFELLAKKHTAVPVYRSMLADMMTPVSALQHLLALDEKTVLLESAPEGKHYARYSYICVKPRLSATRKNNQTLKETDGEISQVDQSLPDLLRECLRPYQSPQLDELPPFTGGMVGYMGYEACAWSENIPVHAPVEDDIPEAHFMLFDTIIAFDHLQQQIVLMHTRLISDDLPLRRQYDDAVGELEAIQQLLRAAVPPPESAPRKSNPAVSNMSRDLYLQVVDRAKDYVRAGDVFQLVASQQFRRMTDASPFSIYRMLRHINPSPYMFYFHLADYAIIGASPEALVKVDNGVMSVRPIAGTRRRGGDQREDDALAKELLADEKERAEHVMLVDLGRNDVGRVAEFDSVTVQKFMEIEKYSHVMHLVSNVEGKLRPEFDALDALQAGFPAGTVSGAPKIRAMEIINELEPSRRNIYSGAIGYLDFHGNLDSCIAIRTIMLKDGVATYQAGAGIVADSVPENEFQETLDKAAVLVEAIDLAEKGLS